MVISKWLECIKKQKYKTFTEVLSEIIDEERKQHYSKQKSRRQHYSKQKSNEALYAEYVECDSNVSVDDLFVELNGLTGLEKVKQEVKTLINF